MINNYQFHFADIDLTVSEVDGNYLEIRGINNYPYTRVWNAIDYLCRSNYGGTLLDKNVTFYSNEVIINL